jgi:hypothetical protein
MTYVSFPSRQRTLYATAEDLQAANPLLFEGEWGTEKITGKRKIGDGVTLWNDLPYWEPPNTIYVGDTPPQNLAILWLDTSSIP